MTASVPKKYLTSVALVAFVLFALGVFYTINRTQGPSLTVAGKNFRTETADTQAEQERGLSGRESLAANSAMVFPFGNSGRQCFWMKDMKFSIDMVWLDAANKVLAIENDVSPATYPINFCHEGQTVIEFAAHTARTTGIKIGNTVQL